MSTAAISLGPATRNAASVSPGPLFTPDVVRQERRERVLVGHVVARVEHRVGRDVAAQVLDRLALRRRAHRELEHVLALAHREAVDLGIRLAQRHQVRDARVVLRGQPGVQGETGGLHLEPDLVDRVGDLAEHLVQDVDLLELGRVEAHPVVGLIQPDLDAVRADQQRLVGQVGDLLEAAQ